MQNDWITIGEAADLLQVSRDTLRRWEKRGKIHSYRSPSNRRMYKKTEITQAYQQSDDEIDSPDPTNTPITLTAQTYTNHYSPPNSELNYPKYTVSSTTIDNPFTNLGGSIQTNKQFEPNQSSTINPNPTQDHLISTQEIKNPNTSSNNGPFLNYKKPNYMNHFLKKEPPPNTVTNDYHTNNYHQHPPFRSISNPDQTFNRLNSTNNLPDTIKTPTSNVIEASTEPKIKTNLNYNEIFNYPSIVNTTNTPFTQISNNLNDFSFETTEEKPDNTIKILKIITAILITILIILGISIFAIIFMQYR